MLVEIHDKKMDEILLKRAELHKELGVINEKLYALDNDRTKLGYQMDKLKEKTKVIMEKLNPQIGEYEFIGRVFMQDGKSYYEVVDSIEEYKKFYKEEKKKKK